MGLTPKQEAFCHEYPKDFNATRSAITAGYSEKTAHVQGPRLLENVEVRKRIKEIIDKRFENADIKTQDIVTELARLGLSDIKDYLTVEEGGEVTLKPFKDMADGQTRCIKTVEEKRVIKEGADGTSTILNSNLKYTLYDKQKSLELLGKYKQMFADKVDVNHSGTLKVEIENNVVNE